MPVCFLSLFSFLSTMGLHHQDSDHWTRERAAETKTALHAPQQLRDLQDVLGRLINTPSKDLFSSSVFSSAPERLGERMPTQEPTDFLGGALLGVSHIVIKSSGFPGRCLQSWEKQVILLPTCLLLHKRKQPCVLAAQTGTQPK